MFLCSRSQCLSQYSENLGKKSNSCYRQTDLAIRNYLATGIKGNICGWGTPFSSIYSGKNPFGFADSAGGVKKPESPGSWRNLVGSILLCHIILNVLLKYFWGLYFGLSTKLKSLDLSLSISSVAPMSPRFLDKISKILCVWYFQTHR